jgi:hypothetical protein
VRVRHQEWAAEIQHNILAPFAAVIEHHSLSAVIEY